MSFRHFPVSTVSAETLDAWFALVPARDPGARDRLRTELHERADRSRLLVSDESGPAAACVIERDPPGATIWTPRTRDDLGESRRRQILARLATYASEMCVHDGIRYMGCTLKRNDDAECAWRVAMLEAGYVLVARKCRYAREILPYRRLQRSELGADLTVVQPDNPAVASLYEATLVGSRDRSTVFEAQHGTGLGLADLVLIAERSGRPAGLCALEYEAGAERGWIKYVGTAPYARGTGTATTLVTAALERLAGAGAKAADSLIDVENHASIRLHARTGFRRMPECGDSYYASLPQLR